MNRSIVGAVVAALCAGLMIGAGVTYRLQPDKTPAACVEMAGRTADVVDRTGKLMSAVQEHATEAEWQRRSVLAGEIDRLNSLLLDDGADYEAAHDACVEASR